MVGPAAKLRMVGGLLLTPHAGGRVVVWRGRNAEPYLLDGNLVPLLLQFVEGATRAEAAAAAELEDDDTVAEVVAMLVADALLVPVGDTEAPRTPAPQVASARIAEIADEGTFVADASGAVVTGFGTVDKRRVAFVAWEPMSQAGIEDVLRLQERVEREPCPIVYLFDLFSIGRDPDVEFSGPRGVGRIYANMARLGSVAPQLGVVHGALFRPAAFPPGLCDVVIFLERGAFVHIGDPGVVKEYTGETIDAAELGGAKPHAEASGLADVVVASSVEAAAVVRRCLSLLPTSARATPPRAASVAPPAWLPPLAKLVDVDSERPVDMHAVLATLLDAGSLLELKQRWAPEIITALARLDGIPIGVVANQGKRRSGVLTVEACDKAARFIQWCDTFGLPLVFLADVPGFAIGRDAERAGIVRAAGRLFAAIARATVPRISFVVRKAHTAGLYAMGGPGFEPDAFLALPTASIAIFGERAHLSPALERSLDRDGREAVRQFARLHRPDPKNIAEIVEPEHARSELAKRLGALLGKRRA